MTKHTISSGLRRCKQLAGEVALADGHAQVAVQYTENSEPAYTFSESMEKRSELVKELVTLRTQIAVANATTKLNDGSTLTSAIQRLAQLKSDISFVKGLSSLTKERTENVSWETNYELTDNVGRPTRVKVTTITVCKLTERQRDDMVAKLQNEFSELNAEVEHLNHVTVLR